jgi:hypothetical protein
MRKIFSGKSFIFHTCFLGGEARRIKLHWPLCYASPSHYIFTSELMVLLLVTSNGFFLRFSRTNFSASHPPERGNFLCCLCYMVGSFKLSALLAQPIVSASICCYFFPVVVFFDWKLNPSDTELINDRGIVGTI